MVTIEWTCTAPPDHKAKAGGEQGSFLEFLYNPCADFHPPPGASPRQLRNSWRTRQPLALAECVAGVAAPIAQVLAPPAAAASCPSCPGDVTTAAPCAPLPPGPDLSPQPFLLPACSSVAALLSIPSITSVAPVLLQYFFLLARCRVWRRNLRSRWLSRWGAAVQLCCLPPAPALSSDTGDQSDPFKRQLPLAIP